MDLQAAEKAIRQGAWAGFLVTGITLLIVSIAIGMDADGRLATWNDPWNFIDIVLVAALSFGVLMRSRASAISLFIYFVASKILIFAETGQSSQIIVAAIILYYFGKAILGSFAYHKIRREQDPEYKPVRKAMYFLWVPAGLFGVLFVCLAVLGLITPSTAVQTGDQLSQGDRDLLFAEGIVDADEQIIMFYSSGIFSIREEGNVITDRRVISYQEVEGEMWLLSAAFEDINTVVVAEPGDFLTDTLILVTPSSGDPFYMYASVEGNGDKRFLSELHDRIK